MRKPPPTAESPHSTSVLLIEDDEDDYLLAADLLREAVDAYELDWERDPEAGLALLLAGAHRVCLLDFHLGGTTGLDVLARARARLCKTPIILLTGQSDRETDMQAMRAGASDYLVKSRLDAQLLERSIRYAIERSESTRALADSERQFRSLMESASDGIVITDAQGLVRSWNPSASKLFAENDLGGRSLVGFIRDPLRPGATGIGDFAGPDTTDVLDLEGVRSDGHRFPVEAALSSWETVGGRMWSAIIRDVTERKTLETQLEHQAFHDPLTGLANRALLRDRLEHALARLPRAGVDVAVLFLDLDDFKKVNDTLGHAAGDDLLRQVAERISEQVRASDTPARLGGDEFAVVLEDVDSPESVDDIAERIVSSLRAPFPLAGTSVEVSASIGVERSGAGEHDVDTLLRHADVAMYAAKERGKNQWAQFEAEMHEKLVKRVRLERELRDAVADSQVVVHYQPIIDLATGRVAQVEALMRWLHPERGLQSPATFVPVAEETGIIVALGRQLRAEAFRQTRLWQGHGRAGGDLRVSVNVSPRELEDDGFVDEVLDALIDAELAPGSLVLEITENVVLRQVGMGMSRLEQLRAHGIRIAIDDFGTGYSSLSYVQDLPADILKIDRSFTGRLSETAEKSLVSTIVEMGRSLGLVTIAEGIESEVQHRLLRALGCDFGQGYHLARPADADATEAVLDATFASEDDVDEVVAA